MDIHIIQHGYDLPAATTFLVAHISRINAEQTSWFSKPNMGLDPDPEDDYCGR